MCFSSAAEGRISGEQQNFFSELMNSYATEFAGQQGILNSLTQSLTPVVAAGVGQQGFGPQEQAAISTQIGQGVGANYAKASQALNVALGARGGGNEVLPSGAQGQLQATLASQAAQTMSGEQLQATMANYGQGRQNYFQAAGALGGTAGLYNPTAYASQANAAGNAAMQDVTQMQQNSWGGIFGGMAAGALGGATAAFGQGVGKAGAAALFAP